VTFPLPSGSSFDEIVVTSDKSGKEYLSDVVVRPCSARAGFQSGGFQSGGKIISNDRPSVSAPATVPPNPASL
jgi:hypothetical protein